MAKIEPGMKIDYLTVLYINGYKTYNKRSRQVIYRCRCDCGNELDIMASNLYTAFDKHYKPSCGCNTDQIRQISKKGCWSTSKTGVRGVVFFRGKWYATLCHNGKNKMIRAKTKEDAIKKRQLLEEKYFDPILDDFNDKIKEKLEHKKLETSKESEVLDRLVDDVLDIRHYYKQFSSSTPIILQDKKIIETALKEKEKQDQVIKIIKENLVVSYDESENDKPCLIISFKVGDDTLVVIYETYDKEKIDLLKEVLL